ncbi:neutral zinc metallopeptidase [Nocardia sp. NPDC024068]|uniref:neutral zinc metallopeptidase n=1 Tax=Nocardia sp. NPDC024068 TaxID=3157197 RepID=UPI0033D6EFAF
MPPPVPHRVPNAPRPRSRGSSGRLLVVLFAVMFVVLAALVRGALNSGGLNVLGPQPEHSYDTGATGPAITATNPLLTDPDATLIPANCEYSSWSTDVDTARAFFSSAEQCLEAAWQPVLESAGLPFEPPTVLVSADTEGISTPCTGSTGDFAAFYCPANRTVYMPISQLQTDYYRDNWVVYLSVFAHEYGHHIQNMSGILLAANSERVDAGARSPEGLELSRRVELQANCFDGMYLVSSADGGALTEQQMTQARTDADNRGDQRGDMRDHGTPENGGRWFGLGVEHNRTAQCNTFTAADGEVS